MQLPVFLNAQATRRWRMVLNCFWLWVKAHCRKAFLEGSPGCPMPGNVPAASAAPAEVCQLALASCHGLAHAYICEHTLPPKEGGNISPGLE